MDLNKFLEENPLLNKAELARKMFPNSKQASSMLNQKLKEYTAGTGKQRITDKDTDQAKKVLKEHTERVLKFLSGQ